MCPSYLFGGILRPFDGATASVGGNHRVPAFEPRPDGAADFVESYDFPSLGIHLSLHQFLIAPRDCEAASKRNFAEGCRRPLCGRGVGPESMSKVARYHLYVNFSRTPVPYCFTSSAKRFLIFSILGSMMSWQYGALAFSL